MFHHTMWNDNRAGKRQSRRPRPVSWAYERPDDRHGFVWGGADFHDNLYPIADYRRFLMTGIVWLAKLEVPTGGIQAPPRAADPPGVVGGDPDGDRHPTVQAPFELDF